MSKSPKGGKPSADAVSRAITVARIATGEPEDDREELSSAAAQLGRKGGKARAAKLSKEQLSEIGRTLAAKRWGR